MKKKKPQAQRHKAGAGQPRKAAAKGTPKAAAARPGRKTPGAKAAAPTPAPPARGRARRKVRPLHDRVLVRRIEQDEQRVGGIIIPDTAREKPQQAEVIAVGSGRVLETGSRVPPTVKAGDRVLVGKWSGSEVKLGDEEYLILKEDEILGIIG